MARLATLIGTVLMPSLAAHGDLIRVTGRVERADGRPVSNAVVVTELGGHSECRENGTFELRLDVPTDVRRVRITGVTSTDDGSLSGSREVAIESPSGDIDAGVILLSASQLCDPSWLPSFGGIAGVTGTVRALAVFDDGSGGGPALYVGGDFTIAGGVLANRIVRWDGSGWSPLGSGANSAVRALAVYDDGLGGGPALYAAGDFVTIGGITANRIAKWNGSIWSALGLGVGGSDGQIEALAVYDSGTGPALYAGGGFTSAGGSPANKIARWNGTTWAPLGSGASDVVYALVIHDDELGNGSALFVGGAFFSAGGMPASCVAKWNGTAWSPLGTGVSNAVHALEVFDDGLGRGPKLYAAGNFTMAGGAPAARVARWDGASWSALGSGVNNTVNALKAYDDGSGTRLYATGAFTNAGGTAASRIARWDGSQWSALGSGVSSAGRALASIQFEGESLPRLAVGGGFTIAGGLTAQRLALWSGSEWSLLDHGFNDSVWTTLVFDDGTGGGPALFVAGGFETIGGQSFNRIAKWNGTQWLPLGSGLNGLVYALATLGSGPNGALELYAGGEFTTAGGISANHIARWTGSQWLPLGSGTSNFVTAMIAHAPSPGAPKQLYVGGQFTSAGGVFSQVVARWTGSQWLAVGGLGGPTANIFDFAHFDDGSGAGLQLYAAGSFQIAGGAPANFIARRTISGWASVGGGTNGPVSALLVYDDGFGLGPALYAAGSFTLAGGVPANGIAKWDGGQWSPLGEGLAVGSFRTSVEALAAFDDGRGDGPALFAGGDFTVAGGKPAAHIARWGGRACNSWSALPGTLNDRVLTFAVFETGGVPGLIAGGSFRASPAADSHLARYGRCPPLECLPEDFNCDGLVNGSDLGTLLGLWGPCDDCVADLNCDGLVDHADLELLLRNWGIPATP